MASSSSAKKKKQKIQWDRSKFVSEEAQIRYYESVEGRPLIAERGLTITQGGFPALWSTIQQRGWGAFCAQPSPAVVPLVREFYANAPAHENGKVFVRGKRVSFSGKAINKLFGLPEIGRDGYTTYYEEDQVDYQAVLQEIAVPGTTWKTTEGRPVTFKSIGLKKDCKAWHYFVGARLMPVRHMSDVTKERAVLIYCIVTGRSVDVGHFISAQIENCYKQQSMSLFFPSVVTALCVASGVQFEAYEETLAPMAALNDIKILRMKDVVRMNPVVHGPPVAPPLSRPLSMPAQLERLDGRIQQLQDYMVACQNANAAMLRQIAQVMGVDVTQFPPNPVFPGTSSHDATGSSAAADAGDDDETMDEEEL